ncbi:SBBP repeat-containing protein [Paraflavisolibacter sp. H34]|uniref:SBBP repeat-containing protein n=1 Tax=Huijunlia imazamoxiresistens TaxID=3127457 RepID=UPI003016DD24
MKSNQFFRKPWLLAALLLLPALCFAQLNRSWVKRYNATGPFSQDAAHAAKADAAGNVYVTGSIENSASGRDIATIKRDKDGNQLWLKKFNGPANEDDAANALALDASGNVYVTGHSTGTGHSYDVTTIKYDKNGVQQWVATYNGPDDNRDIGYAIAVDAAANVYVTGKSDSDATFSDYTTLKYDKNGVQQWVARYAGPNDEDYAYAIGVDTYGSVYITGESEGIGSGMDYATIKYDRNGVQQWLQRYNGPGDNNDRAFALALDASGNVWVTGISDRGDFHFDYATVKYNSSGVQQWAARYNGTADGRDKATALALDSYGNIFVTGESEGSGTSSDYATVKYNQNGVQQWAARYNGTANGQDKATALSLDSYGNIFVTGESETSGAGSDYATIKYSAAGVRQWVARFNGTGNGYDAAKGLAVDASGNVHVAGNSWGQGSGPDFLSVKYGGDGTQKWVKRENGTGNGSDRPAALALDGSGNVLITGSGSVLDDYADEPLADYLTVKYNADGNRKWEKRYNGPADGNDQATALAADNAGNVYVTGYSRGNGTRTDYATIKYNPEGTQLWAARYNGVGDNTDSAHAIAVDANGNVYVTGVSYLAFATIKYDKYGVQKWVARYTGPGNINHAPSLTVDALGNVYISGTSGGGSTFYDYATIKYNNNGVQQWAARYNGPANGNDRVKAIAVDVLGNVYVTGQSEGLITGSDYTTIKYDKNGLQKWVARFDGENNTDEANALALDGGGNVLVTGKSWKNGHFNFTTLKYDTNGQQLWEARNDSPVNAYSNALSLAVDGAGNVYVTGESYGSGTGSILEYFTVRYTPLGQESGADHFSGTDNSYNRAVSVVADKKGNVYVTGESVGRGTGYDYLTIRYAPSASATTRRPESMEQPIQAWAGRLQVAHYPNPVATNARIQYELPSDGQVTLKMYDLAGKEMSTLVNAPAKAGTHIAHFNASRLPAGIYHYRLSLQTGSNMLTQTGRMSILR